MKKLRLMAICLTWLSLSAQTDTLIHGKIPIDAARWYQLNNVSNGLQQLYDGDLYTRPGTGWGKILSNYDAYYPIPDGMNVTIDSVKMFDWEGTMDAYPVTFYVIKGNNWARTPLATFTGDRYNGWDGPYPARPDVFALDTPATHVRYIVMNSWYEYPTEVEFYGSYKPLPPPTAAVKNYQPLKNFFGINAFEWDFEDPSNPMVVDSARMVAIKNFSEVRHYMDWQKPESVEGKYTFSPVHSGGWNYDTMYARCKAEGIVVVACLKTLPDWMQASYPADQQDAENVPVRYGKDFSQPASYLEQARVAFQYAARYGSNRKVNPALVTVDSSQRWTNDDINKVKIGLNLVKYIECDNERDKWWKGRKAYQTGREYAANLSAFYDGDKQKLGPAIGVKNADANMQVVVGGLASANTDYIRGMIDWCKEFRGYKSNGQVNLCWDVINYHLYANDARNQANAWPTTGVAPELSTNDSVAAAFIKMAHGYAGDMPVWITETGYDVNQGSPQKAVPIGAKSAQETQGDWILRTALTYARTGVQRLFFYSLYDDNPWSGGPYATSGLVNDDRTPRPAADYIAQTKKLFGPYTYQQTLNTSPAVDKYTNNNAVMYALWVPAAAGSTANYTLDLGNADSVFIYKPRKGYASMALTKKATVNGHITLALTETPCFAVPKYSSANMLALSGFAAQSAANLSWQVSQDSAIQYYTVERSTNGADFNEIGKVASGRSLDANNYVFNDEKPVTGTNYYRLKKKGVDSSTSYTSAVAVSFSKAVQLTVYPNPATHDITIDGLPAATTVNLSLINNEGKVLDRAVATGKTYTWNVSRLTPGVYYIAADVNGKKLKLRFVKGK